MVEIATMERLRNFMCFLLMKVGKAKQTYQWRKNSEV